MATPFSARSLQRALAGAALALLLSACGGGGGDAPAPAAPAPTPVVPAVVAPAITTQPGDRTITENGNAAFSVVASGTGLSYQWQNSTDAGANWADLAGATAASLNLTAVPLSRNNERLRVRVSNSAGTVTSTAVLLTVNAAGAPRAWQTAERLRATDEPYYWTAGPVMASNASGVFIVAWVESDPVTEDVSIFTRRYTPGFGWGPTDLVITQTGADRPQFKGISIGLAPNGNAAAVFMGRVNFRDSLYGTSQTAGGAWAVPTLLENDDLGPTFSRTALVVDNNGFATAVWNQDFDVFPNSFNTQRVLAARMAPDGSWGPAVNIDFPAGPANGMGMPPKLAVNANGDVVAAWTARIYAGPDAGEHPAANIFTAATGWGLPVLIGGGTATDRGVLEDVAIAADGSAVATFHRINVNRRDTRLARFTPGAGWAGPLTVALHPDSTGQNQFSRAQIADDGTAVVNWMQSSIGGWLLYTTTVATNGTVGTPLMLNASLNSNVGAMHLRRDAAGNMVAIWSALESGSRLVSRVRDASGNWGAQTNVWVGSALVNDDHALSVAPDGTAAAAWYVPGMGATAVPWANIFR